MAYPSKLKGKATMQQRARNMQQSLQRRQEAKSDTAWAKPKAPAKKVPAVKPWKRYKRKKEAAAIASREKLRKVKTAKKKAALKKLKTSMKKRAAAKKSRRSPILDSNMAAKPKRKIVKTTLNRNYGRPRVGTPEDFKKWEKNRSASTKLRRKQQKIRDRYKD